MKTFDKNQIMVVSNSPKEKLVNFFPVDKRVKISNFIGWFCLKCKLLEQKTDTGVSFCDTDGLSKIWAKTGW